MRRFIKPAGCLLAGVLMLAAVWQGIARRPDSSSPVKDGTNAAPVVLNVPYISQEGNYPTGCESVSAVMLLRYMGIDITVDEFIDSYLDCGELYQAEDGTLVGPSPNDRFVGDPRRPDSYGCYAPVIERACQKLLPDGYAVKNLTGGGLSQLAPAYIDRRIPLLVWATIDMKEAYPSASWTNAADGSTVSWLANEHCLVLVGYDRDFYYCNDPYEDRGLVTIPRERLESRFKSLGCQALAVIPEDI